jgi:hypothetical protein
VWRLDTGGYNAATSIPATIELLKSLSTQPWIPAILRLEQRSKKVREDGKVVTHRFAVPVLDLPNITVGKVVARMGNAEAPRIEAVTRSPQPTAAERVAERAAAITSGPAPLVPREAGPVVVEASRPEEEVRDDPQGEPPLPVEAGAPDATPLRSEAGSAIEGNPMPAPDEEPGPAPSQAAAAGSDTPAAPSPCGARPPAEHPLGMTAPCELSGAHRAHRSTEGTWPA